jgi:hypothetical protein
VLFPRPDGSTITATSAGTVGAVLELRLKDATISWQLRNPTGVIHTTVPGLLMNGPINIYGVRWTFWN